MRISHVGYHACRFTINELYFTSYTDRFIIIIIIIIVSFTANIDNET